MQLHHARYFVATADAGSVSGAAAAVHVTQPALSRQLRQFERDLGVTLFDRGAGRLTLNDTGRALLPEARRLLDAADALRDAAAFHRSGRLARMTIAAPTVTLTDVVSPFVATMSPEDPVVDVRDGDGLEPAQMLRAGADLALGTQRPPEPYAARPLAVLPVWAYVRPDHPWAGRGRVGIAELITAPLVLLPTTFTAREAVDAAVTVDGGSYATVVEAANGTIAQALAAAGRGIAVVSDDPRFDLVPLRIDVAGQPLRIRLVASWDPRGVAAGTVESLIGRLGEWIAAHYES